MSELDDIRAIVAVIDHGGFAKAARRLGIAKSIVSRRIARLEGDLGTRLLNRTTRGINPTEAALEFKARGERILRELADARDAVARRQAEIAGRLRLALPLSFGIRYIAPVLAKLARDNPRLEIDAAYSDRHVDLLNERFDAAVVVGDLKDSALVSRRIAALRGLIVASPAYLSRHGTPVAPSDLSGHECLVYTARPERFYWQFLVRRRRISILPAGRFHADHLEGLLQAAEAGLGIAALPSFLTANGIEARRLVPLLIDFPLVERSIYIVRPPGPYVPARLRALIDLLVECFDEEPAWDCRQRTPTSLAQ
jgi:DNA-binding transcriptional LysR family regulator